MIKLLVEKDMAYRAPNGDVYFSVMNFLRLRQALQEEDG